MLSRGTSTAPSTAVAMMTVRIDARRATHGAASEPRIPATPTNTKSHADQCRRRSAFASDHDHDEVERIE